MSWIITNPPHKRKRRVSDNTYLMIQEDKSWVPTTEIWEFSSAGCLRHPADATYATDDGYSIEVFEGAIKTITSQPA